MAGALPTTTTVLLDSLRDQGNDAAWREFDARYRPVLTAIARSVGLCESDAAEVAQSTLADFVQAFRDARYDRGKGRLAAWIIGIARHRIARLRHNQARNQGLRGDSMLGELPDEQQLSALWEQQRRREIVRQAYERLLKSSRFSEKALKAFELVSMRNVSSEEAAAECQMTVDEVYVARYRVTERLTELVRQIEEAFAED